MACCSNLTGLLQENSLLRGAIVYDQRNTEEKLLVIMEISAKEVYAISVVAAAALVVAGLVVAGVTVAVTMMESRLIAMVVVVNDSTKAMMLMSAAPMLLVDVIVMLVVGYQLWLSWWYWLRWQHWVQSSLCRGRCTVQYSSSLSLET